MYSGSGVPRSRRNVSDARTQDALDAKAKESDAREAALQAADLAKAQTRIATSLQLAALSGTERDNDFARSVLLAVQALQVANTFEAHNTLLRRPPASNGADGVLARQ